MVEMLVTGADTPTKHGSDHAKLVQDMLKAGYGFTDPSVTLGAALEGATVHPEPKIRIPLAMMNRHGLVAGATGTGKTKTLQLLAEQLSAAGVPVFVADIKGDLSGLAMPGEANDRIADPGHSVGWDWKPAGVPVEFVSLTGKLGVQLRATVELLRAAPAGARCSGSTRPRRASSPGLQVLRRPGAAAARLRRPARGAPVPDVATRASRRSPQYGGMSRASVGVLLRKMVELEAQGAGQFFGEPEFDVRDLLHAHRATAAAW